MKGRKLGDIEAKALMHDVFAQNLMPVRFLPDVSRSYFEPPLPAFEPRNAWSLHNAFTTAAKVMPLSTRLPAIQAVGKMFGMTSREEAARDENPVLEDRKPELAEADVRDQKVS